MTRKNKDIEDIFLATNNKEITDLARKLSTERQKGVIIKYQCIMGKGDKPQLVESPDLTPEQELQFLLEEEWRHQSRAEYDQKMLDDIEQEKLHNKQVAMRSLKNWKKYRKQTK